MIKTVVLLPNGEELSSGAGTVNAIQSLSLTESVNDGQELTLGSVCAAMAELRVIAPGGGLSVTEGDEFTLCREENGQRQSVGIFIAQKPVRTGANSLKLTAYDRVIRLDKDLTRWLAALGEWPYRLESFAHMVCQACGLTLHAAAMPNADYPVERFSADGITGRQLMKWISELCGQFVRALPDGTLELAWYQAGTVQIGSSAAHAVDMSYENGTLSLKSEGIRCSDDGTLLWQDSGVQTSYRESELILRVAEQEQLGSLWGKVSLSDYQVCPIEKVQLKASTDDIGTLWPEDLAESANTYTISGNYLLTATNAQALTGIAETLYHRLRELTYTPCKVTVPADPRIRAGDILTVTDRNGVSVRMLVMTRRQTGRRMTLECTGSPRRDSSAAVNRQSYRAISGKVMELRLNVDGLQLQNRQTQDRLAGLSLTVDGLQTQVQEQTQPMQTAITQLQQTAQSLQVKVQTMEQTGATRVVTQTGYTFDGEGLHIRKNDTDMENLLDESGMYVRRGGESILQANADGVQAVDVTVGNYLIVGDHARFEDYADAGDPNRTACFWL